MFLLPKLLLNKRMLVCLLIGFSAGLPLFMLTTLLQAWLAKSHLDIKTLGLFALVMFPYNLKFFWAPLMDHFHFGRFGRRRGWMGMMQLLLFISIGALGMFNPKTQLPMIVCLACFVAFFSASQDIAIDAFRREILSDNEQGLGVAMYANAFRMAGMVPGGLSLILAEYLSWQAVFWITAIFMVPGMLCTYFVKEPGVVQGMPPRTLREAAILPFQEFIYRNGWQSAAWILAFILFYKLGDSMATALATKFYLDMGFSLGQIGLISKSVNLWGVGMGVLAGGLWMVKLGINRSLWVFGIVQAVTILGFWWLARAPVDLWVLGTVVAAEAFGIGLGTVASVAFIARTTDPRYTATQMALLTSIALLPRTFMNATVGYIVAKTGWLLFFLLCFCLAIPGMLMLFKVAPWNEKSV